MVDFAGKDYDPTDLYKLMIGSIVPRPIGWVSTIGNSGQANIAPFSFFNGVTFKPPTVCFSVIDRGKERKDTSRNVAEVPEFVVQIVSEEIAEQMNHTCGDFGAHIDEFAEAGLTPVPGTAVKVPWVREAKVAMECRLTHNLRIGPSTDHIIGEVVYWHIADEVLIDKAKIDPDRLRAVGRMGGTTYSRTLDRFSIDRPVIPDEDPRSVAAYRSRLAAADKG